MNLPVPRNKKEKTERGVAQSTAAIRGLEERFVEIDRLVDPADRLLMLGRLYKEVQKFQNKGTLFIDEQQAFFSPVSIFLGANVTAGAAGFLLLGPVGAGIGVAVSGTMMFLSDVLLWKKRKESFENMMGFPASVDLLARITASYEDITENTNILTIAESPHAVTVFTKFPALKEKFWLAAEVNKVLESQKADRRLGLDKPKPAQDDIRL